jgi:ribosome-associated toxin RatA of RatAB toxin-antitoxin module
MELKPLGLFNLIFDQDKYKEWMPFCKISQLVKQVSL